MSRLKLPSRTAMSPVETRSFTTSDTSLNGRQFEGHAAVFNKRTAIGNPLNYGFYEQVAPGAFSKSIQDRADVIFDQDHDLSKILSRVSNNTLELSQDSIGLATRSQWADVSYADDLAKLVEGRFITGMSFMFQTVRDDWQFETVETNDGQSADVEVRTLLEVKLIDVCVTSYPAYAGTDANMRSAALAARAGRVNKVAQREVGPKKMAALAKELRQGKTLSADSLSTLQDILDLIAEADNAVDQAQPLLAALMGVPNPDSDDGGDASDDDDESSDDTRSANKKQEPVQTTQRQLDALLLRKRALQIKFDL